MQSEFIKMTHMHKAVPCLDYLLQGGVRDAIAGEAKVGHGSVELSEERAKGPIFSSSVGQDVGDLLTDAFQEDCLRDVFLHELTHC